ncbi:uncharacterized protein LOC111398801 [Olea europaea var. sylvestris]|uniref:Uncharacterized protein n=1 Tax=Olea europaea subsp. europaea TaxID=158383 RepID=A0A8S0TW50_OLEEU|nr:uncharacterized protein LOC111398801 [Olea europaea var. sylvestris]CAA3010307.1 Hypothetical predicted protein [Olea europaea subsp. europaea]
MVLWEITLGTAYFLGLKRTYRLALKIQRKLISPKHPKIRQFAQRRTRAAFDVALTVHRKIQERDIEVGRNLGNWILRWLDKMKPSAQIRVKHPSDRTANTNMKKPLNNSSHLNNQGGFLKSGSRSQYKESTRHLFTAARNMWPKPFPSVAIMMQPMRPAGSHIQYRQFSTGGCEPFTVDFGKFGSGIIRNDIRQWILQN